MRVTRGSLAKSREVEEARSKICADPIFVDLGSKCSKAPKNCSKKKRKFKEIAATSGESKEDREHDTEIHQEIVRDVQEEIRFVLKGTPTVTPRMQCYTNVNVIYDIAKALSADQMRHFLETICFSHLINMTGIQVQAQFFRCFILFEVEGSSPDAFIIHINGFTLRFTIREFALISGLKCCDEGSDFVFNTDEPNRLLLEYFDGQCPITKQQFVDSFNNKVWGDNEDDAVKFALLHFIHNFIMSEEPTSTWLKRRDFDIIESGRYRDYSWGNEAFRKLTKNLHGKMTLTKKYYRIFGFPLAMQIWLFECCSDVDKIIAKKVDDARILRILNWETTSERPHHDFIMKHMFQNHHKQHINVIFYYLRKKAKYSTSTSYSFTTVDCNISGLINGIWEVYADLDSGICNASSEQTIVEYINGFRMLAATAWHTVDNIFIPVNMKDKFHWFLLVVSLNDRSIMVYDSIRYSVHDSFIDNEVKKYTQFLVTSDFYKKRDLDVTSHPKYKNHSEYDSFEIVHVTNIPEQEEGSLDCGAYMAVFAEYLSDGNGIPPTPIDPYILLSRYVALLWDYGMRKIQEDVVSDSEAPGKPLRTNTDSGVAERIFIE